MSAESTEFEFVKLAQENARANRHTIVSFFMENMIKNKEKSGAELVRAIFSTASNDAPILVINMLKCLDDVNDLEYGIFKCAQNAIATVADEIIDALHDSGYNFNYTPEDHTPLIYRAIDVNLPSLMQKLISYGMSPSSTLEYKHHTPLSFACFWNVDPKIVKLLLDAGVNPNKFGLHSITALRYAIRNKSFETVKLLAPVTKYADEYMSDAIKSDDIDIVREILAMSGSVVLKNHVLQAYNQNRLRVLEFFLQSGFDMNCIIFKGYALIHFACERGSLETIQLLLKYGAKTDIKTDNGMLPIFCAMSLGHQDIVEILESHSQ